MEERDASLAEKERYESALQKQKKDLERYAKKVEKEKKTQEALQRRIQEMESKV